MDRQRRNAAPLSIEGARTKRSVLHFALIALHHSAGPHALIGIAGGFPHALHALLFALDLLGRCGHFLGGDDTVAVTVEMLKPVDHGFAEHAAVQGFKFSNVEPTVAVGVVLG